MNMKKLVKGIAPCALLMFFSTAGYTEEPGVETETPEVDMQVVSDIAADFGEDFAGGESETLITALRNGDGLSYETEVETTTIGEDGKEITTTTVEAVTVENTVGAMGYGEISIALGLAESLAEEGATFEQIVGTLYNEEGTGILDLRAGGMGWGQVFHEFDTTVGAVISGLKANERALAQRALAKDKLTGKRPERSAARVQRADKPERPEKPERAEKPERPEKPERAEKPEKPSRPGRS